MEVDRMANVAEFAVELELNVTEEPPRCTRADVLKILQALGAKVGRLYATTSRRRQYVACLSCAWETWIEILGEPQDISDHYDLLAHLPFQAWDQPVGDDVVTCVGHLFERAPGRRWVTLARVLL
jgi:hypothetical protein